jgi:hypothetical protein
MNIQLANLLLTLLVFVLALIVTFIFKNQISKQNQIIDNLNKFVGIIDISKIKEYADLRSEADQIKLDNIIKKHSEKWTKHIVKTQVSPKFEEFKNQIAAQYNELINVAFDIIVFIKKEERRPFIEGTFPESKEVLLKALDDYELNYEHLDTPLEDLQPPPTSKA